MDSATSCAGLVTPPQANLARTLKVAALSFRINNPTDPKTASLLLPLQPFMILSLAMTQKHPERCYCHAWKQTQALPPDR